VSQSHISIWQLFRQTGSDWVEDKAPRLGAALAYYSMFSIAPLVVIVLTISGLAFGEQTVSDAMDSQLRDLLGESGAEVVEDMVKAARKPSRGIIATMIGLVALLFGASGVFGQLQDALNTIWEVKPKPGRGLWGLLKDRFISFAMVLGTGFLLLVSLMLSAALAVIDKWAAGVLPGPPWIAAAGGIIVSFLVTASLFAMIFKIVPDAEIAWKDVWAGAFVTAFLFALGKYALGLYLGRSDAASAYGAAGSLMLVLVWTYYSAQILFLGAEFTQAYAHLYGSKVRPAADAISVQESEREQQGLSK
jgi:membrane protein